MGSESRTVGGREVAHLGRIVAVVALAAGLWGIENDPALPAPIEGNARETVPRGLKPLPHDLKTATDRLTANKLARATFGDRFIDHFVKTRYQEEAALRREVSAAERRRYLETL